MKEKGKTDLESMTTDKRGGFTWGKLVKIHHIGDYDIVEYYPRVNGRTNTYEDDVMFHPFVNGRDTCHTMPTLDAAIVEAIAYKAEGPNSQATFYFCRMVGINKWEK